MNDPLGLSRRPNMNVPASETPRPEALLSLATGVVIVAALYLGREVLIPITLSIFLSFFLAPIVRVLQRLRFPKAAAVIVAVVVALGIVALVGMLIGSQFASLVGNLPQYQATVINKFESIRGTLGGLTHDLTQRLNSSVGQSLPSPDALTSARPGQQPVPVVVEPSSASYLETAREILAPVLSPLGTLGIVLIVTIFILTQQEDLRDRLIRLFGSNDLSRTTAAIDDAVQRLTRYFLTQAAINGCFGVLIGVGLFFLGIPSPVLWGVLAALLRFVPYVGPIIAAFFPVALSAAVSPGWSLMLWTAGLFVVAEGVTGQVLEPLLYGSSAGLSPTAVIIVAIFWSWIWGPIGLVLSTPMTLCLVVLGRHVRHLEFFDVLLGDRPALTPIETFCQRLLAGDPDEIVQQAESLLETRSLLSYYDDVALKGLQLLAHSATISSLQPERLEKIRDYIHGVVLDLDDHEDVAPKLTEEQVQAATIEVAGVARPDREMQPESTAGPGQLNDASAAWRAERSVLCVAGRGPLDGSAAAILAQLLRKRGFGAQAVSYQEVSRSSISRLETANAALICITYLEIVASPPHMRYLVRRARQHFPGCPIVVGFWASDDKFLNDPSAQRMSGGDVFVSSLRDAVNECLTIAHGEAIGTDAAHREGAAL
jgi:predicted PurR-regulated permease PerM